MTILITLSLAGTETGPFDLYSNVNGFTTPFDSGVSRAALLAGYETTAPDGTITVRLDDLNALCTPSTTDIYSCAIPNCDFTGTIICPVTTTTTTTAEPTTTTTTAYPGVAPCTWSTYGGNPGQIAVYDFDTNSSTAVLVPNDFTATTGINRPICSTGDKLWMTSVLIEGNDDTSDDIMYIREWDINTSGATPTLSYVREITVNVGGLFDSGIWGTEITAIAVTGDNNILLAGFGAKNDGENSMGVYSWDISTAGNITLNESNTITKQKVYFGQSYGTVTELTGMFITNNNNVILSARYYEDIFPAFIGNYIKEYVGLPPVGSTNEWGNISFSKPIIRLQSVGVPEFTNAWTNPNKAMPMWGVNGLLQVIQPETLEVYNISQTPNYAATLATTVADDTVWIHTSTGCANVEILSQDEIDDCTPTALPILVASNGSNYIGPITFTYSGMSVIASSNIIGGLISPFYDAFTTNCGITIAGTTQRMHGNTSGATLDNPAFSYTLEFPVPVNNIPLRTAILNTSDDFRFTTNVASTTISIVEGCRATVQNGNELITDIDAATLATSGSVEVVVTGSEDFTILTFVGTNQGYGGPWSLGCTQPPLDCTLIYATIRQDCASNPGACYPGEPYYSDVFAYSPITGITEQLIFPAGTNFQFEGISISENYINITLANTEYAFTRYTYDLSSTGVPENIQWEGILYTWPSEWSGLKAGTDSINDTKFVYLYGFNRVLEVEIIEGSTVLSVTQKFIVESSAQGDCLITYKPDGVTPNKVLYHQLQGTSRRIYQYDYNTGTLDGSISTPLLSNGSYLTSGDLTMIGNYIYTSDVSSGVFYRYNTVASVWEIVPEQPNPGTALDSGSRPECRISDGITSFDPPPTTTTTTTISAGVNTIWTWFEAETPV